MRKRIVRVLNIFLLMLAAFVLTAFGVSHAHTLRALPRGIGLQPAPVLNPEVSIEASRDCLPEWGVFKQHYHEFVTPKHAYDSAGVVLYQHGGLIGWQYTPYFASELGMAGLRAWCDSGDRLGLQIAIQQGEWIVNNADTSHGFATWHYDYPHAYYRSPSGWTSGLGNGYAMAFLLQLHAITEDQRYFDLAELALGSFTTTLEHGGVRHVLPDGSVWFEEVAHSPVRESQILNGHILAVLGLGYFADHTGNALAEQLTLEGIGAVRASIHEFDLGNAMRYELLTHTNIRDVRHYAHEIATVGLYWMAARTNDDYLREWGARYSRMITAYS